MFSNRTFFPYILGDGKLFKEMYGVTMVGKVLDTKFLRPASGSHIIKCIILCAIEKHCIVVNVREEDEDRNACVLYEEGGLPLVGDGVTFESHAKLHS